MHSPSPVLTAETARAEVEPGVPDTPRPALPGDALLPAPAAPSECPPPLNWADVLTRVERESREIRIERASVVIAVRSFGEGPPIYFLGSALGDWRLFALTIWLLRDEFRTVVVSPPQGKLSSRRFTPAELAADLFAAADRMQDKRFALFGASLGTLTAWQAMLDGPERIDRATLFAPVSRFRMSATERLLAFLGRFSRRPMSRVPYFTRIQQHNHRRWFPPFDATRWEFLLGNIGTTPANELCRRLRGASNADLTANLPAIHTPCLLLHGEGEGPAARSRVTQLAAALSHAEIRLLPHCGQFPFVTHPHVLVKAVKEYLP